MHHVASIKMYTNSGYIIDLEPSESYVYISDGDRQRLKISLETLEESMRMIKDMLGRLK